MIIFKYLQQFDPSLINFVSKSATLLQNSEMGVRICGAEGAAEKFGIKNLFKRPKYGIQGLFRGAEGAAKNFGFAPHQISARAP